MFSGMPSWADAAIRSPHQQFGYVQARYNGQILTMPRSIVPAVSVGAGAGFGLAPFGTSPFGTTPTVAGPIPTGLDPTWLPMIDGQVEIDGSTPGVRRTLRMTLSPLGDAAADELFDLLSPSGVELLAFSVLSPGDGRQVVIPQGVFPLESATRGYGVNGNITLTAPDRWSLVKNSRFLIPRAVGWNPVVTEIGSLLLEACPAGTTVNDLTSGITAIVPAQTVDRDRDKLITDLATANSIDVFFDRYGQPTIRRVPELAYSPVWTVDASQTGVLMSAGRTRSREKTYNVVIVDSESVDGSPLFDPVAIWDSVVQSATYAGPDPLNRPQLAGPFGIRPIFYSSSLITDAGQATQAATTIFNRVSALENQLSLTAVLHPGLDDGDTIRAVLPTGAQEMHIVDSLTIPLNPTKSAEQSITTRSNRPDAPSDS